jgi:hypothetical protein
MMVIEIVALFFLCKKNGLLALRKGLKSGLWQRYTILAWIVAESIGVLLAIGPFGNKDMFSLSANLMGLTSAFGGYLFIKYILEKKPDFYEDDINSIGVDDLHPPRN